MAKQKKTPAKAKARTSKRTTKATKKAPVAKNLGVPRKLRRGFAHQVVDMGNGPQCACGTFCHTFGKPDLRKLQRHIDLEEHRPNVVKTYEVKRTTTFVWHVEATSRDEAEQAVADMNESEAKHQSGTQTVRVVK